MNMIRSINGFYCEITEDLILVNSEFLVEKIDCLLSDNFEGWSEESKDGYLTAMIAVKEILNKKYE